MLAFLNVFFFVFHTAIVLFNIFGWIPSRTRKWNLLLLVLTGLSWSVLGIWYGWGYCPSTDWHWQVREKMGYVESWHSYIQFLIYKLTGIKLTANVSSVITGTVYLVSLVCSVYVNVFKRKFIEQSSND